MDAVFIEKTVQSVHRRRWACSVIQSIYTENTTDTAQAPGIVNPTSYKHTRNRLTDLALAFTGLAGATRYGEVRFGRRAILNPRYLLITTVAGVRTAVGVGDVKSSSSHLQQQFSQVAIA